MNQIATPSHSEPDQNPLQVSITTYRVVHTSGEWMLSDLDQAKAMMAACPGARLFVMKRYAYPSS